MYLHIDFLKKLIFFSLIFFVVGFIFIPTYLHKNLYYFLILLPFFFAYPLKDILRDVCRSRLFLLSVLYIFYMVLASFWGEGLEISDHFRIIRHSLTLIGFLLIVYALLGRDGEAWIKFFRVTIPLICMAGVGLIIWFYLIMESPPQPMYPTRLHNPYLIGHPIQGATLFGFIFLITYFQFFNQKEKDFRAKLFWLSAMIVELGFILLTQSRGPLVAVLGSLVIGGIFIRDIKVLLPAIFAVLGGVVLSIMGIFQPFERADAGRFQIWKKAWEMVGNEWIWGRGYLGEDSIIHVSFGKMYHAHNLFINHFLDGGAIAFLLISAVIILGLRFAFLQFRFNGNATHLSTFSYIILAFLTDGADLVDSPSYLWLAFWMPVAFAISFELHFRKTRQEACFEKVDAGLFSPAHDHH